MVFQLCAASSTQAVVTSCCVCVIVEAAASNAHNNCCRLTKTSCWKSWVHVWFSLFWFFFFFFGQLEWEWFQRSEQQTSINANLVSNIQNHSTEWATAFTTYKCIMTHILSPGSWQHLKPCRWYKWTPPITPNQLSIVIAPPQRRRGCLFLFFGIELSFIKTLLQAFIFPGWFMDIFTHHLKRKTSRESQPYH